MPPAKTIKEEVKVKKIKKKVLPKTFEEEIVKKTKDELAFLISKKEQDIYREQCNIRHIEDIIITMKRKVRQMKEAYRAK